MSRVIFQVFFVELEHEGDYIYRKHGGYRFAGSLIKTDSCGSLKEVCKWAYKHHLHIELYRDLMGALNGNLWSQLQKYITWKWDNSVDGNW